jgi:O-methyltransferase
MIRGPVYIDNLRLAAWVLTTPGCIVECGTWRGGMIAGIADLLGSGRSYYLYDSFQGLPPATEIDGELARRWQADTASPTYYNNCAASEEEARTAMSRSAAKTYRIVKGWFEETLPKERPSEPIALLRMDADWYESTKCILDNLIPRMAPGGMVIVDDYYAWEGCTAAVNEFVAARKWQIRQSKRGVCFMVAPDDWPAAG